MGIIAISRGSFSGGKAVAEQLGQRLGYPVLGREQVLHQAAEEYGVSEQELAHTLNQKPAFWQQALGKRVAYVKCVTAALLDDAQQGNLIYHGNVGHLLFSGVSLVLRVRVIADMERRIKAAMEYTNTSREQAISHIHHVDKERSRWAQMLYAVNWDDPSQYDLIVNLEEISVATACDTIARLAESADFAPTAASRASLENLTLSCRVWAAMAKDPKTRRVHLEVTADNGNVVITGSVGSQAIIDAITRAAKQVDGVKNLDCQVGMGSGWLW